MNIYCKTNTTSFENSLRCEVDGLSALRDTLSSLGCSVLQIPQVFSVDDHELRMDRIDAQPPTHRQLEQLGAGLAALHRAVFDDYGYEHDNYIGLSPQRNGVTQSWGHFFLTQRLQAQVEMIEAGSLRERFEKTLELHGPALEQFLDAHCQHPSLVHGDLWTGNVMFDAQHVWLIDPAIYRGDREVDVAMTEMFGGFGDDFLKGYDASYPRSAVYPIKRDIYNLYHYLNHYNLFGPSYLTGCERGFEVISCLET